MVRLFALIAALGVALVAWFGSLSDYPHDRSEAIARTVGATLRQTACGNIEYAEQGAGPSVLIVHGAGGGFDQGMDFAGFLADGHRVIAVSRFGYLRSPLPADASSERQGDLYACLLDSLGIDKAAVLGASAGGPSAMQFALRHPDRTTSLILLVPAAYTPRAPGAPVMDVPRGLPLVVNTALRSDLLFWLGTKAATRTMIRTILGTPPELMDTASAAERDRVRRMLDHILPVSLRRLGLANDAAVIAALPRYDLDRIATPTLLISMEDDLYGTYASAKYTAEQIPGARFIGFPTGGHLGVGHQTEITGAIAAFLGESDLRARATP